MPLTVVETDAFPTTLQVPAASEPASAPGLVAQFLQGIANRTRWLFNRVNVFVQGGVLAPSGSVNIHTPTTQSVSINQFFTDSAADGGTSYASGNGGLQVTVGALVVDVGNARVNGQVARGTAVQAGSGAAGINLYASAGLEHLYLNSTATSGCIWKLSDSPADYPDGSHKTVRVSYSGTVAITVESPGGTTLCTLAKTGTGNVDWAVLACISGIWTAVETSLQH